MNKSFKTQLFLLRSNLILCSFPITIDKPSSRYTHGHTVTHVPTLTYACPPLPISTLKKCGLRKVIQQGRRCRAYCISTYTCVFEQIMGGKWLPPPLRVLHPGNVTLKKSSIFPEQCNKLCLSLKAYIHLYILQVTFLISLLVIKTQFQEGFLIVLVQVIFVTSYIHFRSWFFF